MLSHIFNVDIAGYWRDKNKSGISAHSGVYFVYETTYNQDTDTVTLHRLIYIGESENVNSRIMTHDRYNDWLKYVRTGNELCFSTGQVGSPNRARVESAYIFNHKPPANIEYANAFPFDQTTVISTGRINLLNTNFTVNRT